jgi:hypothetical protein
MMPPLLSAEAFHGTTMSIIMTVARESDERVLPCDGVAGTAWMDAADELDEYMSRRHHRCTLTRQRPGNFNEGWVHPLQQPMLLSTAPSSTRVFPLYAPPLALISSHAPSYVN